MKAFALILGAGLLGAASALPAKLTKREICNLASHDEFSIVTLDGETRMDAYTRTGKTADGNPISRGDLIWYNINHPNGNELFRAFPGPGETWSFMHRVAQGDHKAVPGSISVKPGTTLLAVSSQTPTPACFDDVEGNDLAAAGCQMQQADKNGNPLGLCVQARKKNLAVNMVPCNSSSSDSITFDFYASSTN